MSLGCVGRGCQGRPLEADKKTWTEISGNACIGQLVFINRLKVPRFTNDYYKINLKWIIISMIVILIYTDTFLSLKLKTLGVP